MRELGGESIMLSRGDMQLGRGETIADTARVLSRYVDAIMLRTARMRSCSRSPSTPPCRSINGLTDRSHPCQLMADVMTFEENKGPIEGRTIAWLGDGNNVAASWIHAAARFGFALKLACPKKFSRAGAAGLGANAKARASSRHDPKAAVRGADCVVTDAWVSMGDGEDKKKRKNLLKPFQVDERRDGARQAGRHLHALPAGPSRRGGDRRGDRRPAIGGVGRGREPAACAEGHSRLVPRAQRGWAPGGRGAARAPSEAPSRRARRGEMMASESSSLGSRIELVIPNDDLILPFQADQADVFGRLVKLGPVVDTILSRHDYPEPVSKLLGEAVALTALLGAALKFEGKFILQASTDGPVDLLVADYQVPGQIARLCALLAGAGGRARRWRQRPVRASRRRAISP